MVVKKQTGKRKLGKKKVNSTSMTPKNDDSFCKKCNLATCKELWTDWKKQPYGMKLLISYNSFIAFFYLVYLYLGTKVEINLVFGYLGSKSSVLILSLIYLFVVCTFVYGLLTKKSWTFRFGIVWFFLGILDSILTLLNPGRGQLGDIFGLMLFISSAMLIVNIASVWYLTKKEDYLVGKQKSFRYGFEDRIYYTIVFGTWGIVLLSLLVQGMAFQSMAKTKTAIIIDDTRGMEFIENMEFCATYGGLDTDLCYLVHVMKFDFADKERLQNVCDKVEDQFLRFTCRNAVGGTGYRATATDDDLRIIQKDHCTDGIQNADEVGLDCGGSCDTRCPIGSPCDFNSDCRTHWCNSYMYVCDKPSCDDGIINGLETDEDCGGDCEATCENGEACNDDDDCSSGVECRYGACAGQMANAGGDCDIDGDGYCDEWEKQYEIEGMRDDDDDDGDGLLNIDEWSYGTDPFNADSDGDGASDYDEIYAQTNPMESVDKMKEVIRPDRIISEEDRTLFDLAWEMNSFETCSLITDQGLGDDCYRRYALRNEDSGICENVISRYNREICIMLIHTANLLEQQGTQYTLNATESRIYYNSNE